MCYIKKYLAYVNVSFVFQFRARLIMQLNKFNSSKELRVIWNRPCLLLPRLPFYRALVFCVHLCGIAEPIFLHLVYSLHEFMNFSSQWRVFEPLNSKPCLAAICCVTKMSLHRSRARVVDPAIREHVTCLECFFFKPKEKQTPSYSSIRLQLCSWRK